MTHGRPAPGGFISLNLKGLGIRGEFVSGDTYLLASLTPSTKFMENVLNESRERTTNSQ